MSLYNPEGVAPIVTSAVVHVERLLPQPGDVLVRVGSRVEPEDVVATAFVPAPPHVVNVAQALAIPADDLPQVMRRQIGETIKKGDELARSRSIFGGACVAPIGGEITTIDRGTGYVTIAPDPLELRLNAALRGVVMEVKPHRGVRIETPAAQVYGAFGIGSERIGVLSLLVTDPSEMITADMINARSSFAIVIGGSGITTAALRAAVKEQVRGVIVGSIQEHELRAFLAPSRPLWQTGSHTWHLPDPRAHQTPGVTIVVTEGFGTSPMAQPIFDLLSSRDRQEAMVEGNTHLRHWMHRPRVIVPYTRTGGGPIKAPHPHLVPGAMVRLLDSTHLGQVARVQAVSHTPRRLATGIRTAAVELVSDNGAPFWVPCTAVEVLAEPSNDSASGTPA